MVEYKKFPQRLSKTQKMRMQRQIAIDKRQLIDVHDKTLLEEAMELEKVEERMVPSVEKKKFGRKATEDMKSMSSASEVMDSETLLIGEIPISLNWSTISLTFLAIFKLKKAEEDLVKVEGEQPTKEEDVGHRGVTIYRIQTLEGDT